MKKIVTVLILIIVLSTSVLATTLQTKVNEANKNVSTAKNALNNNTSAQKNTLKEINTLDQNINSTEQEIEGIENELEKLETKITIAQENIKYMEEEFKKENELVNKRLVASYKAGDVSFWDIIFSSNDVEDMLSRYNMWKETAEFDNKLLTKVKEEKAKIEKEKAILEEDQIRCENLKEEVKTKLASLEERKEIRTKYLSVLKTDQEALQESLDAATAEANKLAEELKEYQKAHASEPYTGGQMVWPLPNFYIITSKYGYRVHPVTKKYSLHTGVDIAGTNCNGKPVVAAAAGKVIKATYSTAYGNYVVIDHGGGITTLYAHSSKLIVKAGDQVSAGQEIMKIGTTGYSTGPHLHFEVRVNGAYKDPLDGWIKK